MDVTAIYSTALNRQLKKGVEIVSGRDEIQHNYKHDFLQGAVTLHESQEDLDLDQLSIRDSEGLNALKEIHRSLGNNLFFYVIPYVN